ncbi:MAG: type II toxin-antitoxin system VapC family toxin [Planctomycetes bacterium]|nr:type II toxin-antitoxin system VapC family toxin [Planctomycetota bacterium]
MAIPTVYVETTVVGHLAMRLQRDRIVAGRQLVTREWWAEAPVRFRLFVSDLVIEECEAGDPVAAAERLIAIQGIEILQPTDAARNLAERLVTEFAIPATEPRDAFHVAIAAVNGIKYLATWNFKHIANVATRDAIEQTCRDFGCEPPKICTPDELLGA